MAKVKESRFALLHVEDDSDEDSNQAVTKKGNQTNKNAPKKSKNKKKKNTQQAENEEVCLGLAPLSAICFYDNQFKFNITDTKAKPCQTSSIHGKLALPGVMNSFDKIDNFQSFVNNI